MSCTLVGMVQQCIHMMQSICRLGTNMKEHAPSGRVTGFAIFHKPITSHNETYLVMKGVI